VREQRNCLNRGPWSVLREIDAAAKRTSLGDGPILEGSPGITARTKDDKQTKAHKPVRDGQHFVKRELLKHLSPIVQGMIGKATEGGTAQLKLLWALGKLDEDPTMSRKTRPVSLGKLLMDEVRKREAEKKGKAEPGIDEGSGTGALAAGEDADPFSSRRFGRDEE
jgi:hypothetical protein